MSRWLEQDWIKQNPAYNTGVFIGQLAGLAQAATEYVGAGLTFVAGTAGSGILDAFVGVASGGTAAAAIPAMAVAEMAAVTAATAAIGAHASKVLQNNFNSRNYSSSSGDEELTEMWNKGSHKDSEASIKKHFKKHGQEVGAKDWQQYVRKAKEFARTAKKGSIKSNVPGEVKGVIRYKKNGKYIDLAPDGTIISFGKQ